MEKEIQPFVGMGATEILYSDKNPYTVIEVISKNKIKVQEDEAINIAKEFYSQEWDIKRDTNGCIKTLIKTKKGWKVFKGTTRFILGVRKKYFDYSF